MARRKKLTEEELRAARLQTDLENCIKHLPLCSEPSYKFNVGDKVSIGNLENVVVKEVLENNKIYKINYSIVHHNYGKPQVEDNLERYVLWHEIRPINNNTESFIQNDDLILNDFPVTIESILSDYYHFGINMSPDYQRDIVWELSDKQLLIDSIFKNVDIGKFVFSFNGYALERMYDIVDGKQRLNAIIEYYENRFPYKGKYYNDLSFRDKQFILNYPVVKSIIKEATREDILRLFIMLNTTGRRMDKSHLDEVKEMYSKLTENNDK